MRLVELWTMIVAPLGAVKVSVGYWLVTVTPAIWRLGPPPSKRAM